MESPRRSLEEDVLSLALRETEKALDSSISRALDEASRDLYASACGGSDVDSDLEDDVDGGGTRGLATMQEELRRANEAVLSTLVETHRSAAAKRAAALARVEAYRETRRSEGKRLLEEAQRGAERTPAPRLSVASGLPPELAEVEGRHRQGRRRVRHWPTSKAPIAVVFHAFRLTFGRAIISRNGLEA